MKRLLRLIGLLAFVSALVAAPLRATAHDKSAHQGATTKGRVSEITGDRVVLATDDGKLTVQLSPETNISRDGTPASREELKVGETIELEGPKLPGGGVAAREIWIHSGNEPSPKHEEHGR